MIEREKQIQIVLVAAFAGVVSMPSVAFAQSRKPNVVVIMPDNQG